MALQLGMPESTTILRWLLRFVLVIFLAWLVRRRPEEEDDEDEAEREKQERAQQSQGPQRRSMGGSGFNNRAGNRFQQAATHQQKRDGRDMHTSGVRERRTPNSSFDFDSVIDKISKPKEMWEVRKDGDNGGSNSGPSPYRRGNAETNRNRDGENSAESPFSLPSHGKPKIQPPKASTRDAREKEAGRTLHGHERPVTFLTWSEDSSLLFTCGKDKIVCVWSFQTGEQLGVYRGHNGAVWACSVTADARWLVTSGADQRVIVWEARTSTELARVELPGVVRFVEWANTTAAAAEAAEDALPTPERFVTCHNRFGSHPAALTVWRFDGSAIEQLTRISTLPGPANQVRWGRDDAVLASAHENGQLIFWRADTGEEVMKIEAHSAGVSKFDFSSDRRVVATASLDKLVRVWELGEGTEHKLLYEAATDRPLNAVALGPLTRESATSGKRPTGVSVIAAGGQDVRDVAKSSSDSEQFGTLLYSLPGNGSENQSGLKPEGVTKGHFGPVHTLAFARHGGAIASGSEDGCVRLHVFEAEAGSGA